jgi:hypothetical protein
MGGQRTLNIWTETVSCQQGGRVRTIIGSAMRDGYALPMRKLAVLILSVACACGGSAARKDAAVSDGSVGEALATTGTDAEYCPYGGVKDWPTDAAACIPAHGFGKVYDLNLGVDAGDCSGRPVVACDGSCGPGPILYGQIEGLVHRCLSSESTFVVTFSEGCADRLYLETPYYRPEENAACVAAALANSRFACAEQVPCWQWYESTLL